MVNNTKDKSEVGEGAGQEPFFRNPRFNFAMALLNVFIALGTSGTTSDVFLIISHYVVIIAACHQGYMFVDGLIREITVKRAG